jgi:hypothetical protein
MPLDLSVYPSTNCTDGRTDQDFDRCFSRDACKSKSVTFLPITMLNPLKSSYLSFRFSDNHRGENWGGGRRQKCALKSILLFFSPQNKESRLKNV